MTISAISPAPTYPIDDTAETAGLDPAGVLTYCSSRLSSLDSLIQTRFAEQQQRNQGLKEAGALLSQLNQFNDGMADHAVDHEPQHQARGAGLAKIYATSTNPEVRAQAAAFFKATTGKDLQLGLDGQPKPEMLNPASVPLDTNNIKGCDETGWQASMSSVKTLQDSLSKDGELSMIQLQSIVSQRQLAVQMTTQLLSTMSETSKQVVNNWK